MPAIVVMRLRLGVEGVRHGSGQPRRTANECAVRRVAQMVVLPSKFRPGMAPLSSRTRTHAKKASAARSQGSATNPPGAEAIAGVCLLPSLKLEMALVAIAARV